MPYINIEEQAIFYRWSHGGQGNDITLLLIHGLGSSHSFYEPITLPLSKAGYSCLSIDTPGSGLSKFSGRDRSPKELAGLFIKILDTLDVAAEKTIVVGHSMGGMIASELADIVNLRGAVLLGPVHPTAALAEIFAQRIKKVEESGLEILANTIPTAATGSKATSLQHGFIRTLILMQAPEGYNSLCRTIANAPPPDYARARCGLLVLAGADDKTSPLPGCETIYGSWGGAADQKKLQVLEGVGHWHCIEAPEEVGRSIEAFASKLQ